MTIAQWLYLVDKSLSLILLYAALPYIIASLLLQLCTTYLSLSPPAIPLASLAAASCVPLTSFYLQLCHLPLSPSAAMPLLFYLLLLACLSIAVVMPHPFLAAAISHSYLSIFNYATCNSLGVALQLAFLSWRGYAT